MSKIKLILTLALVVLAFGPTIAIQDAQAASDVDISGRWVDDRDQVDIKQSGDVVTGDIGINGSSFTGTRNGDVITFNLVYRNNARRGVGRKSTGELMINSDGTRLTGTRSGGAFKKGSKWVLTRENN
ncbi:MAG: hypothetical protein ACERLB_04265 [Gammaproteobacteria bacterium]